MFLASCLCCHLFKAIKRNGRISGHKRPYLPIHFFGLFWDLNQIIFVMHSTWCLALTTSDDKNFYKSDIMCLVLYFNHCISSFFQHTVIIPFYKRGNQDTERFVCLRWLSCEPYVSQSCHVGWHFLMVTSCCCWHTASHFSSSFARCHRDFRSAGPRVDLSLLADGLRIWSGRGAPVLLRRGLHRGGGCEWQRSADVGACLLSRNNGKLSQGCICGPDWGIWSRLQFWWQADIQNHKWKSTGIFFN